MRGGVFSSVFCSEVSRMVACISVWRDLDVMLFVFSYCVANKSAF